MARVTITATLIKKRSFETAFGITHIFVFTEENKTYVWKTSSVPLYEISKTHRYAEEGDYLKEGDICKFSATIGDTVDYNGEQQTKLSRCSTFIKIDHTPTVEEKSLAEQKRREAEKENRKKEQLDSIGKGDLVWTMPYRQYKMHYSDCETVIDSYRTFGWNNQNSEIDVIIRKGRLVNSGVRGKHYDYFYFKNTKDINAVGGVVVKAITEENARKRMGTDWELVEAW